MSDPRRQPRTGPPSIEPLDARLGAEVRGLDLSEDAGSDTINLLRAALDEYLVLFFREQHLNDDSHVKLASRFGPPMAHPALALRGHTNPTVTFEYDQRQPRLNTRWHTDLSYAPRPPAIGIARAVEIPIVGGDTLWADMYAALSSLPTAVAYAVAGRHAVHDATPAIGEGLRRVEGPGAVDRLQRTLPPTTHPILCRHPRTGRHYLFVNPGFTTHIEGIPADESTHLLEEIYQHLEREELRCRCRWTDGTVVLWDERATQHRLLPDYQPQPRAVRRVTVAGTVPIAA